MLFNRYLFNKKDIINLAHIKQTYYETEIFTFHCILPI